MARQAKIEITLHTSKFNHVLARGYITVLCFVVHPLKKIGDFNAIVNTYNMGKWNGTYHYVTLWWVKFKWDNGI